MSAVEIDILPKAVLTASTVLLAPKQQLSCSETAVKLCVSVSVCVLGEREGEWFCALELGYEKKNRYLILL